MTMVERKSTRQTPLPIPPDLSISRAQAFEYVRQAHQSETAEDYVEMIADLIAERGEARVVDLAANFGVSHATVNKIIVRLNKEGLVTNRPYRSLFLTVEGERLAAECKERHDVVYRFLLALGLDEHTASLDAEGVEHHVSPKTLQAFRKFLKKNAP
ncbi:MAG: manganese-binding transcriptional regulator MntR [Pseudobdellovibrionaceae bacterium]|nr:manganese-binding transcriptional regulator MntR [Pseudobdellovibrionaceae bacterium]